MIFSLSCLRGVRPQSRYRIVTPFLFACILAAASVGQGVPPAAAAVCGDGVPDSAEQCDPGTPKHCGGDRAQATCNDHRDCPPTLLCLFADSCCEYDCELTEAGTICAPDGNTCTSEICDGGGVCTSNPNRLPCDDNDPCTLNDFCSGGTCTGRGTPDCTHLDTICAVGVCEASAGGCTQKPTPVGSTCSIDQNPCTDDGCDGQGNCVATDNTAPCDDGNPCTENDTCSQGACGPGPQVDCSPLDGECVVGVCNASTGFCEQAPAPHGTPCTDDGNVCTSDACDGFGNCLSNPNRLPCDDGDPCTTNDRCSNGLCVGGPPPDCSGLDGECSVGVCDSQNGGCVEAPLPATTTCTDDGNLCTDDLCNGQGGCEHFANSAPCSDGNECTLDDVCASGVCTSGPPVDCSAQSDDCNLGVCNVQDGSCSAQPLGAGTACTDDGNVCTDDRCDGQGTCDHPENTGPCDDGNPCTDQDACSNGSCTAGPPTDCSHLDSDCMVGVCDLQTGGCTAIPATQGTACTDDGNVCTDNVCDGQGVCESLFNQAPCEDGNFCSVQDVCSAGTCGGGSPRDCSAFDGECTTGACNEASDTCFAQPNPAQTACADDGNLCTNDVCNGQGTCVHPFNQTSCEDGDFCTVNDVCSNGQCVAGPPRDCSAAGDECNAGICDEALDSCQSDPLPAATACSDDGNVCTDDICDGQGACSHPANIAPCEDGAFCTTADTCSGGTCRGGAPLDCSGSDGICVVGVCDEQGDTCTQVPAAAATGCPDDGNVCTDDLCDGAGTCTHPENQAPCEDGDFCTVQDTCLSGQCIPGNVRDCSAFDGECTAGVCDDVGDTCFADPLPAATACGDDGEICTDDVCDGQGTCTHPPNTAPCEDGSFCTDGDVCAAGACTPGATRDCSAADSDCAIGVCDETLDTCIGDPLPAGTTCTDDGNVCTDNVCDGAGLCEAKSNTAPCDDGSFCTDGDGCSAGTCVPGGARDCSAQDTDCTTGVCDETTDACTADPLPSGTACTDDGNSCTDNACDGAGNCAPSDNAAPCDDGLFCTDGDVCSGGSCTSGPARDCSAEETDCRAGACDETNDVCFGDPLPDGSFCDDGLFCTSRDGCIAGVCTGSGDPCLGFPECNNTCNEGATGPICDDPAGTACSDDGEACTSDECDGAGSCVHLPVGGPCDDGDFCTDNDFCDAGICQSGPPAECDDGIVCTNDSCDPARGCMHQGVTLRSACDWVLVGGNSARRVDARVKYRTEIFGDVCADRADLGSESVTEGIWSITEQSSVRAYKVRPRAEVRPDGQGEGGNVLTGGGGLVAAGGANDIFNTNSGHVINTGVVVPKPDGGVVDTTGTDPFVQACHDAQDDMDSAAVLIQGLGNTQTFADIIVDGDNGPGTFTISPIGQDSVNVVDIDRLLLGQSTSLILDGGGAPGSVNDTTYVLRISKRFKTAVNASITLVNGTQPRNVFILSTKACLIGKFNTGAGTLLCRTGKAQLREGTVWRGAVLTGRKEAQIGELVTLIHEPFLAF